MKRITLALALLASMQIAGAQVKTESAAKAAVESAKTASENPKKATKVATWLKLGQAYVDAYNSTLGNGWIGAGKNDLKLVLGNISPKSSEEVSFEGKTFLKDSYANSDYYFDGETLTMIVPTNEVVSGSLEKALKAYCEAAKVDVKGTKASDISEAVKNISQKYVEQAYNQYTFGKFDKSSELFELAANASKVIPGGSIDTNAIYNAGLTAWIAKDYSRAKTFFQTCLDEYTYEGTDGDVYAKLSDICDKTGDKAGIKDYLERGFSKFPQSQGILIGLINYYITSGEDTGRLFDLISEAKKNEPTNASLYYVEGNINKELGKIDEAIAAYEKCVEINPEYEYGFIGEGILFYNMAIEIGEKAQAEADDKKYEELAKEFEESLKNCIKPFERAFDMTKDESLKVNIAEYLKNATYRFREEDANYMAAYEKYSKFISEGK